MARSFEEKCRIYKQQQTVSGKRTQTALDEMANRLQKVTNRPVPSGRMIPLVEHGTGKITDFIER